MSDGIFNRNPVTAKIEPQPSDIQALEEMPDRPELPDRVTSLETHIEQLEKTLKAMIAHLRPSFPHIPG